MKLLLIAPCWTDAGSNPHLGFSFIPPLGLGIVAALTPPDWDIKIVDENFGPVDYDYPADIVGLSFMTGLAPRGYAIADEFRRRGRTVALGGIHVTSCPEEATQHANAVVVGEAEHLWPQLVADFLAGRLQPVYRATERPSLETWPGVRRDLFPAKGYFMNTVTQTTRGCPFRCHFCSVTQFFGHTYRHRPVADVVREVEEMNSPFVGFVDDNIVGNPVRAKHLFRELAPLNVRWLSQASVTMAQDEELVMLAQKSGCIGLFIGFESLNPAAIAAMGKPINVVSRYESAVQRLHDHGIGIEGAFIFGIDEDDESSFERTVDFAQRTRLEAAQFGVLTPFPGTPLSAQMEADGRILDRNWGRYDMREVVYRPKQISPERLKEGIEWAWREFYSYPSILRRLGIWRQNLKYLWGLNLALRRAVVG